MQQSKFTLLLYLGRLFYFILVTKYNLNKVLLLVMKYIMSCTFENVTKYRCFVILFFSVIIFADCL